VIGETRRCNQCWAAKPYPSAFIGKSGKPTAKNCTACLSKYSIWSKKTDAEKVASQPKRVDPKPTGRVLFSLSSQNKKTGPMPVSISERGTCPPSCSFYDAACYASSGHLGAHWRGLGGDGSRGHSWQGFLGLVKSLPEGAVWRHNEAGDLAGEGESLDLAKFGELVEANAGRRGFTYTHKTRAEYFAAYQWAILEGFTVNLSADSLEHADALLGPRLDADGVEEYPLPVTCVLPADAPDKGVRTPAGRRVVVCPAQTSGITCVECELCANPFRHSIVGFRSHGRSKDLIPEIVRRKRLPTLDGTRVPS